MRLSTATFFVSKKFGDLKAIEILAKAGFDCLDFSFFEMNNDDYALNRPDYMDYAKKIKQTADNFKISFNQAHAPFPSSVDDEIKNEVIFERLRRSMEVSGFLGIENIVIHPMQHLPYIKNSEKLFDINMQFYKKLIPFAEKYNVKIAIENMFQHDNNMKHIINSTCSTPEEFIRYIDTLDSKWITACLDIGHCAVVGQDIPDFIKALGKDRLKAVHIHDVDYEHDNHVLPYFSKLNWDEITAAFKEIGYTGDFTYEVAFFLDGLPVDEELYLSAISFMVKVGRHLISKIQ